MSKVYIAGKITRVKNYREQFAEAERHLKQKGYETLNPARIKHKKDAGYSYYYWKALSLLKQADYIYLMPCAWQSPGAKIEMQIAELCQIPRLWTEKNIDAREKEIK